MRRITIAAVSLVLLGAAAAAAPAAAQGPPVEVTDVFTVENVCAFPVLVEVTGKTKTIFLPGGRAIFTAPGQTATFTNLDDPSRRETVGITGAFHVTFLENGEVELVATGRNLLIDFDPVNPFIITIGRFSVGLDAVGNVTEPLSGHGRVIDVCGLVG